MQLQRWLDAVCYPAAGLIGTAGAKLAGYASSNTARVNNGRPGPNVDRVTNARPGPNVDRVTNVRPGSNTDRVTSARPGSNRVSVGAGAACELLILGRYSYRNACAGSTCEARYAG